MIEELIWAKLPFYTVRDYGNEPTVSLLSTANEGKRKRYDHDVKIFYEYGVAQIDRAQNSDFLQSICEKKMTYVTLISKKNETYPTIGELAKVFKNGIIKRPPHLKGRAHQVHVYPLIAHDWFKEAFYSADLKRTVARPDDPYIFVDGKLLEFFPHCLTCKDRMRLVVHECAVFHPECSNPKSLYFGLDERPTKEWFDAHPLDTSALNPAMFRTPSQVLLNEPFEPAGFWNVWLKTDDIKDMFDERSDASILGAKTKRFRSQVCSSCMQNWKNSSCSCRGGCSTGPYMDDDFQAEVDAAQPWQLHVLCEPKRRFDPNKFSAAWSAVKNLATLAGPTAVGGYRPTAGRPEEHDDRYVFISRELSWKFEHTTIPYLTACRALEVEPCETMKDAEERFNNGEPFSRHVKAAAHLAWKNGMHIHYTSGGWGRHGERQLVTSEYYSGTNKVTFYFSRSTCFEISKMCDLNFMPTVQFRNLSVGPKRHTENCFIRDVVSKTKINLPPRALRQFYQHHKLFQYDWVIPVEKGTPVYEALNSAWRRYKRALNNKSLTCPTSNDSSDGQPKPVPPVEAWLSQTAYLILSMPGTSVVSTPSEPLPTTTTAPSSLPSTPIPVSAG